MEKFKFDNVNSELFYNKNEAYSDSSTSYDTDEHNFVVDKSTARWRHENSMSIIASASNDVKFHQWPDGVIQQSYVPAKYDDGHIKSLSWGKDGSWVVLVPYSGPAEIISIRDSVKLLQTIDDVYNPTCATFPNSTKKNIAVGTLAGQVLMYDIKGRTIRKRYPRARSTILQLQYNAKDTHLAASCTNGEILVFNSTTSHLSSSYRIPKSDTVSTINFHRTKRSMLAAGSEEGIVAAWDTNTNSSLLEIQAHQAPVTAIAYSPLRSDMLVTGGLDRRFTFYDTIAKQCIIEVEVRSSITALDFSYCGTYLGLGSQAGGIVLYDTRNLNKPITAFPAHDGKRIRHLLFQKVLLPKEQQNNSSFEISLCDVNNYQQEEAPKERSQSGISIEMLCDDSSPHVGDGDANGKTSQDGGADSFLMALGGWNNSYQTESELKESTLGLGITEGVKKWIDASKRTLLASEHKSLVQTPAPLKQMSSTPKYITQDLPTSNVSPIIATSEPTPLRKSVSLHSPNLPNPNPSNNNQFNNISAEELKKLMREVVKEEFASQLEAYKNEVRTEFAETLGHMRRHFLDLQMSIVKEFVAMETAMEKMNNVTVREFVCDDFLLNQNNKLIKELDSLKEQMVEKDLCRRKF